MSDMNDKELFEAAISDQPLPDVVTEADNEPANDTNEAAGRVRDDKGRFAAKEQEEAQPVIEQKPVMGDDKQSDESAHVPSWRLREVREAREAAEKRAQEAERRAAQYEREMAQIRQQTAQNQPEPDWYADPNAAFSQGINPLKAQFENALQAQRNQFSEMFVRQSVGNAKVEEIKQWVNNKIDDPILNARVAGSTHPWGELVKAYDEHKTLSEIGTDPKAYVQKKLDEALNDPAFLTKALERARSQASGGNVPGSKPNAVVQLPPSLNRATSAASPHDEVGDMSDANLYAFATKR